MKKLKPRARGRSYPIRRRTCHITIVLHDTSVYEYEGKFFGLKKGECKNKYKDMTYHHMYNSGGLWKKK